MAEDWMSRAACAGATDVFFSEGEGRTVAKAKAICATCPVRQRCLDENLHEVYGVWGGTSPRERRRLRRGLPTDRGHSPAIRAAAERLIAKGYPDGTVESATGVPARTVLDWRRQLGIRRGAGGQAA